jgi:nucleoside-diphosphate-sugar epimerase
MLVLASPCSKVSGRVFNVGATEQNFQKQNIVDLIRPFVPDATVQFVHKNEDPRDYRVSFGRIHDELGFRVTRTVPHGISEVAQLVQDGIIRDFTQQRFYN